MIVLFLLGLLLILVYIKVVKPYSYWTERGVKQRKQIYLLGDLAAPLLMRQSFYDLLKSMCREFPNERYFGIYQATLPTLVIKDAELVKTVLIKDFQHFVDRRAFLPANGEPFWAKNLFSLVGDQWRQARTILSPAFTSSKMRGMFHLICECSDVYVRYLLKGNGTSSVELKDLMTRFTNDVISTVAYGIQCDSINEKDNVFYTEGKKITTFDLKQSLLFFVHTAAPGLSKLLGLQFFSPDASQFFEHLIKDTVKFREEKGFIRHDMIHLLMEAKKTNSNLSDDDIAANAFVFFVGGFESVSTTLCFMGYELAINPDIQRKLQKEVDDTLNECNGTVTYEALLNMKYMDMVVMETLRKWPSNSFLDRVCTKPYTISPVNPNEKELHLKPGDNIMIPSYGLHHDPEKFENPDEFNPERFSNEKKYDINAGSYVPFGLGPRNCIGLRLATLEVKTLYFYLLSHFDLVRCEKTEVPLILSKSLISLVSKNGVWIGFKQRSKTN